MSELLAKTREICKIFEIKPSRSKGQNFLINEKIYDDIVTAADIQKNDLILEVGPGLGFLTAKLAEKAKQVIAVELDDKLAMMLQTGIDAQEDSNIKIINENILRFDMRGLFDGKYKVVANLPYNITSIFLRRFLSLENKPTMMVLMLQKEVAERIAAQPGDMSILAVSVQYYAQARVIREVKAGNFWPEPKVDSAVIEIKTNNVNTSPEEDKLFFRMVKIGFSARRKMLKNNLAAGLKMEPRELGEIIVKSELEVSSRAEDLSVKDWHKLFANLKEFMI